MINRADMTKHLFYPVKASIKKSYIHGYDPVENIRLQDQASTLVELLHVDTAYAPGSTVL